MLAPYDNTISTVISENWGPEWLSFSLGHTASGISPSLWKKGEASVHWFPIPTPGPRPHWFLKPKCLIGFWAIQLENHIWELTIYQEVPRAGLLKHFMESWVLVKTLKNRLSSGVAWALASGNYWNSNVVSICAFERGWIVEHLFL